MKKKKKKKRGKEVIKEIALSVIALGERDRRRESAFVCERVAVATVTRCVRAL